MVYWVYVVECRDKSLYTGIAKNVLNRVWQHNNSRLGAKSIKGKLPVKLLYEEKQTNLSDALKRESEIKSWKREKKLKLIASLQ